MVAVTQWIDSSHRPRSTSTPGTNGMSSLQCAHICSSNTMPVCVPGAAAMAGGNLRRRHNCSIHPTGKARARAHPAATLAHRIAMPDILRLVPRQRCECVARSAGTGYPRGDSDRSSLRSTAQHDLQSFPQLNISDPPCLLAFFRYQLRCAHLALFSPSQIKSNYICWVRGTLVSILTARRWATTTATVTVEATTVTGTVGPTTVTATGTRRACRC